MATMGHDETTLQSSTVTAGFFDSSGWSVNFGAGSSSATGSAGPASVLGVTGNGIAGTGITVTHLLIAAAVYLIAKEVM